LNLPSSFITTILNTYHDDGRRWLAELPALIDEASRGWGLTDITPVENLSYNFVAYAYRPSTAASSRSATAQGVVLKISVPNPELTSEMAALRLFNGEGAARLFEADPKRGMCLLERLFPGEMLSTIADDDQRTHIAADVMLRLWKPVPLGEPAPQGLPFIKLSDWFAGLDGLRPQFGGGTGPFPQRIFEMAEALIPELFATSSPPLLIHGDLHHFNILSSGRGWRAIDPKGVIGPPEYEVGPLLINPIPDFLKGGMAFSQAERRIAILSERLGFAPQRIRDWAICHSILSAWWDIEDSGEGSEYALACAEVYSQVKV
jgi:streptomycin 6-kinase